MAHAHHTARILLIRHALTPWNIARRIQGRRDIPLCAEGVRMAQDWATSPLLQNIDSIYASPLSRAMDTGRIIGRAHGLCPRTAPGLEEQNWGDWDGITLEALRTEHAKELGAQAALGWGFCPPNGESRTRTRDRALACLRRMACENDSRTVLAVAHNGVLRCILYHFLGMPFTEDQAVHIPKHYAVHTLAVRNGDIRLERHGDVL